MPTLIARFAVTGWDSQSLDGLAVDWLGAVRMSKSFTSGLIGESTALFVSSGEADGERAYFAAERITATTDDGRRGSVTVYHGGLDAAPDAWMGHLVPASGTEDFADWRGTARIEHDDEGAFFVFDLVDPPAG